MTAHLTTVVFRLNISRTDYLQYYRGVVRTVVVSSEDGRTVSFPANVLRGFLGPGGIQGVFVMHYDDNKRFVDIERINEGKHR